MCTYHQHGECGGSEEFKIVRHRLGGQLMDHYCWFCFSKLLAVHPHIDWCTLGHPRCAQGQGLCQGHPDDELVRHGRELVPTSEVGGEHGGDIYCATCWKVFLENSTDTNLHALKVERAP